MSNVLGFKVADSDNSELTLSVYSADNIKNKAKYPITVLE